MGFIGVQPTSAPLTASDITDAIVSTSKLTDDAVSLAKMASGTDGNIISYDASGNPVAIATGNDGQVLTSTGAGSPPAFEDVSGGVWTKLVENDLSGYNHETKDYEDAALFTSTYDRYRVYIYDFEPQSDNIEFHLKMKIGGSYQSSNHYRSHMSMCHANSGSYVSDSSGGTDSIKLMKHVGNEGAERQFLMLEYSDPTDTAHYKEVRFENTVMRYDSYFSFGEGGGYNIASVGAFTGLRFYVSSGNIESWKFVGYGLSSA